MRKKYQADFTLVEISIGLVLIGLMLGGVIKGQAPINSSRAKNIADQSSAAQAAYYSFIDRYRQIPGDWPAAAATNALGQPVFSPAPGEAACSIGNGRLDNNCYAEASGLWEQLSRAGFISSLYPGGGTDVNFTDGTRAPMNPFNGTIAISRFAGANVDFRGVQAGFRLAYVFDAQIPRYHHA